MMHPVYMAVTKDQYELPYAWADSAWELARILGISVYPILHATGKREKRPTKKSKYQLVYVSDEDEE